MVEQFVNLEVWDVVVIAVYFAVVMAVGIIATVRANRNTAEGFFLAEKSMTFLPLAGSIYASNIGAQSFVGLAGSAASFGYAPVMFEWHATYTLIALGWVFVPIYIASGTYTMPEYLQKRFGRKRIRVYYAIVQLLWSVISGISGEIYAGSLFMQQLLGWDIYLSTCVILGITAVYTLGGGLAAVIYTDALQTVILIIGALIVAIIAMDKVGGYESMQNQFMKAASNETYLAQSFNQSRSCGFPPEDSFHIFRGMDSNYPWPGLVFGLTLLATYYWCTNQVIVQRNLAAKTVSHSKLACVIASYLKILPFFLFVWPGMISRILYPERIACSSPETCKAYCDNPAGCTNIAYPVLVLTLLPVGIRGLMLAAMLAALMSSLTSQFNSSSSVFVIDLWLYLRKKASQFEIVLVGRLFGLLMIGLSIAWLPILQAIQGGSLWDYVQSISAYITPPWVVAFLLGMFWTRLTEMGTWWGLMAGLLTGVIRMVVEFSFSVPTCGSGKEDKRPNIITKVHYLIFAIILCSVAFIVMIAVSIMTAPRTKKQLHRVTWWTRRDEEQPELTEESDSSDANDDDPERQTEPERKKYSCPRRTYNVVCGVSDIVPPKMTKEEKAAALMKSTNIEEDPLWAKISDYNAVGAIAITCFVIGFYA